MAVEIERKFLVASEWPKPKRGVLCVQGYLQSEKRCSIRVRTMGAKAFLTIKSAAKGLARQEFEYPIPPGDARALLRLCERAPVRKIRYEVRYRGGLWEIDEFLGDNRGLVVAEIELSSERQKIARPPWVGEEVSDDARYLNAALYRKPYRRW